VNRFGERTIASISRMSGITERRVADPDCATSDLGVFAAEQLLKCRGLDRESIDLIVVGTETPDFQTPSTACVMHGRLGLRDGCAAFDVSMGCSAFPYALAVVHSMIQAGLAKRAMLVVADTLTKVIHPEDRGLVPLHGDGAMACIVEPSTSTKKEGNVGFFLGTDGKSHHHLMIPASGTRISRGENTRKAYQDESGLTRTLEHMHMNGPAVFSFSLHRVPDMIRKALKGADLKIEDLDLVLLHQANKKMVDQIYTVLGVPEEKRFYFMEKIGNCPAASSAILLAEAWRSKKLQPGMTVLVAGFGVGLSWGIAIMRCPIDVDASLSSDALTEFDAALLSPYKLDLNGSPLSSQ